MRLVVGWPEQMVKLIDTKNREELKKKAWTTGLWIWEAAMCAALLLTEKRVIAAAVTANDATKRSRIWSNLSITIFLELKVDRKIS